MNTNEATAASSPAAGRALEVATGTVAGALHRRLGRPNQDAVAVARTPHGLAIAVCDGCGSGARSEIGAAVGARLWTQALAARLAAPEPIADLDFAPIAAAVLERLAVVADALGPDRAEITREHLLFTSVVAVVTADQVEVAAIGDGLVMLGDEVWALGPFPDNAPPYLSEQWFGVTRAPRTWSRSRRQIAQVVLATDGALPLLAIDDGLAALAATDAIYRNPVALERRLRRHADDTLDIDWDAHRTTRRAALLDDDATLACVRWGQS